MKFSKIFGFCTIVGLFLSGCSATNSLTLGVTEPAVVDLSQDVRSIGLINRSLPSEGNAEIDKIDKILSVEGMHLDSIGSYMAIEALRDQLSRNQNIDDIQILDNIPGVRKGLGIMPASLSWDEVSAICEANQADVLFSLEFFDTNTRVDLQLKTVQIPNHLGVKIAVPGHELTLRTRVNSGWRIYDPASMQLEDELICNELIVSVGRGISPVEAYRAIAGRKEAVIEYARHMGADYGLRLLPNYRRVTRDYFVRGTDNFKTARRRAQTGDWDGAAQLWNLETDHRKAKIAGRACYNMAIINEINGDLNAAMQWASRSYADYNNRQALNYIQLLKRRLRQKEMLAMQSSE